MIQSPRRDADSGSEKKGPPKKLTFLKNMTARSKILLAQLKPFSSIFCHMKGTVEVIYI